MKLIAPLLQFSRSFSMKTRSFSEIKIPVPWGHIAGKWWGPGKTRPVVSLHGWQVRGFSNCASYEVDFALG